MVERGCAVGRSTVGGVLLLLFLLLSGCQLGYYSQAVQGQWALMSNSVPVDQVLADPATPGPVRQKLRLSQNVIAYAANEMNLPAQDVYREYTALDREAVVWNVLAAPPYSLQPRTWCYPVVGCVSYRGYFHKEDALAYAHELAAQGLDTYVGGAVAYSTLGWFSDPLTTPMIDRSPAALVELLLHELTHRRLYLPGHTRFNESLAVMVAREGALRYLAHHAEVRVDWARWQRRDAAHRAFLTLVSGARQALKAIYASGRSEAAMAAAKAGVITRLRRDFRQRRQVVPGLARYAAFFRGPLNNAQLNAVHDYHGLVPAFRQLMLDCGGYWVCFWRRVDHLADDDQARHDWLDAWAAQSG